MLQQTEEKTKLAAQGEADQEQLYRGAQEKVSRLLNMMLMMCPFLRMCLASLMIHRNSRQPLQSVHLRRSVIVFRMVLLLLASEYTLKPPLQVNNRPRLKASLQP